MGFLIFAYRKLSLKRQINDLEYRSVVLSQKKQSITEQIGMTQQMISSAKDAINVFTNNSMFALNQNYTNKYVDDKGNLKPGVGETEKSIMASFQASQYAAQMANNACNSVFEQASQSQLSMLKSVDTQITQEVANSESQLKLMREDLSSVEKAESESAKSDTPKFGLG